MTGVLGLELELRPKAIEELRDWFVVPKMFNNLFTNQYVNAEITMAIRPGVRRKEKALKISLVGGGVVYIFFIRAGKCLKVVSQSENESDLKKVTNLLELIGYRFR